MSKIKKHPHIKDIFDIGEKYFLRHIAIDCVTFGFHQNQLKILLMRWEHMKVWALPGGFVYKEEHIDESARRTLKERTGLNDVFLKQFYVFGDPKRERNKKDILVLAKKASWFRDRFITIGYWALVEFSKVKLTHDAPDEIEWWDIDKIPKLLLDHNDVIVKALESLRQNLNDYPVGHNLLAAKFTMPELQQLYETILDKKLDRRNFQKKMLSLGILKRLNERKLGGAHKAPYYYSFDEKKYQKAMKQGLKFGF